MTTFSHKLQVTKARPSGEYDPYFDQYFDYWATKTFSYDRQTATSRKFSKIAGDRGAATIFFGHSDLVADLKFNDSWKELSSFTIRNELAIIAACNSSAFLGDLKLGPGASAIGFSSNRKDANGTSGYIESGHLGILAARGLDLLQKGFMPKAVAANLADFAKANAKTWGYRVSVDFVEYVPKNSLPALPVLLFLTFATTPAAAGEAKSHSAIAVAAAEEAIALYLPPESAAVRLEITRYGAEPRAAVRVLADRDGKTVLELDLIVSGARLVYFAAVEHSARATVPASSAARARAAAVMYLERWTNLHVSHSLPSGRTSMCRVSFDDSSNDAAERRFADFVCASGHLRIYGVPQ